MTEDYSLGFSDTKKWVQRSPEEVARLIELRQKQQPHVDWSIDWDNFKMANEISKDDVYEAKKVSKMPLRDEWVISEVMDTEYNNWSGSRVKVTLRAGKMLPHALAKKIVPGLQWRFLEQWIAEAGELPGLDDTVLEAVREVQNEGYADALAEIMSGDVASGKEPGRLSRQQRACDLVAAILRGWEAQGNDGGRTKPTIEVYDEQDKEWMYEAS